MPSATIPTGYKIVNAWETEPTQFPKNSEGLFALIGRLLKEAFGPLWDKVGEVFKWVGDRVGDVVKGVATVVGSIAEGARRFGEWAGNIIGGLLAAPKALFETVFARGAVMDRLAQTDEDYRTLKEKYGEVSAVNTLAAATKTELDQWGVNVEKLRVDTENFGEDFANAGVLVTGIMDYLDKQTSGVLALGAIGSAIGGTMELIGEELNNFQRWMNGTGRYLQKLGRVQAYKLEQSQIINKTRIYDALDDFVDLGMFTTSTATYAPHADGIATEGKVWHMLKWDQVIGEGQPKGCHQVTHNGYTDVVLDRSGVWDLSLLVTLIAPSGGHIDRVDGAVHVIIYEPNTENEHNGQDRWLKKRYLHREISVSSRNGLFNSGVEATISVGLIVPVPGPGYRVHVVVEGYGAKGYSMYTSLTVRRTNTRGIQRQLERLEGRETLWQSTVDAAERDLNEQEKTVTEARKAADKVGFKREAYQISYDQTQSVSRPALDAVAKLPAATKATRKELEKWKKPTIRKWK